jgi:hypothetical protein
VLKNVTVTVEEETLKWARRQAAEKGTSVSKLVGQMMEREMRNGDSYWKAYEEWKKLKPVRTRGVLPIRREDTYDRGR